MALINLLNELLNQAIVRYAIVMYIIWLILPLLSLTDRKNFRLTSINAARTAVILLIMYVISSVLIILVGFKIYFPYVNSIFLTLTTWLILQSKNENKELPLMLLVLMLILIPYTVVMIYDSYPLGDDVRFTVGFAAAIAHDGRWIPLKYNENDYYQPFDAEPALTYMLLSTMGVPLKDIPIYYLLLKYSLFLIYVLSIYFITYRLTNSKGTAQLALLLFSITPPLSLTQIVAQGVSIVLALLTLTAIINQQLNNTNNIWVVILVFAVSGVIFHATYPLVIAAYLLPLLLIKGDAVIRLGRNRAGNYLAIIMAISIAYWVFTFAGIAVFSGLPMSIVQFINFLAGAFKPYATAWQPWYGPGLNQYLVSWTLVPAIAASAITYFIIKKMTRIGNLPENNNRYLVVLGLLGLLGIVLNFIARQSTWLGGRYFYWLYLLLLPLVSYFIIMTFRDRIISTLLVIALIAILGFYGVQDPTHSANTFITGIGWANNLSWKVSWVIAPLLSGNMPTILDPRIGTPLFAINFILNKPPPPAPRTGYPALIIIGNDNIGARIYEPTNSTSVVISLNFYKAYITRLG
ncbi:hypothetical protein VMUT_1091 [Vulcanisaeta moutnovskia 768-28]|uniref:Glycosyltransferase RgtA/B/C/D-like domain-containing protein n=1 Tax=Vulcanisaeta moutnovskia (strain 768-28) TaxID=985053 RepID=F0QY59_VULM7|nr:hypothetical protein [Vulcanisaeta moutnovskia]ADY01296.1 hypothetical protein VMUT_1091 [Vulcanisaeta moutnovskia 768-28]